MGLFQHQFPERAENPAPPQLPGTYVPHGRLGSMRRQQLVDLAAAYGVQINPDAPKTHILRQMVTAEEQGILRQQPKLMSRYMKAMRDPDRKLSEFELAEWEAAVAEHEQKEAEAGKKMPVLARMQMEAKKRGIDSRNLNAIELKHLIKDYDERNEIAESDKETVSLGA